MQTTLSLNCGCGNSCKRSFQILSVVKTLVSSGTNLKKRFTSSLASENSKGKQGKYLEKWENGNFQVTFVVSFASDWLRGWCMFFGPIAEQSYVKS